MSCFLANVNHFSAMCVFYSFDSRGRLVYLMGMEGLSDTCGDKNHYWEQGRWGAFGGSREPGETLEQCIAREVYEETAGCINSYTNLLYSFKTHDYALCVIYPYKKGPTFCFFKYVPYKDYPHSFYLCKQFCQYVHGNTDVIEKTHLKWFYHDDVMNYIAIQRDKTNHPNTKIPYFRHKLVDVLLFLPEHIERKLKSNQCTVLNKFDGSEIVHSRDLLSKCVH